MPNTRGLLRAQLDADADGYGNACDADVNNSGGTTASDYAILRSRIGTPPGGGASLARIASTDPDPAREHLPLHPGKHWPGAYRLFGPTFV